MRARSGSGPRRSPRGRRWLAQVGIELRALVTVRRTAVGLGAAALLAVAQPWGFLAAFAWLDTQGVTVTALEVAGLSNRNQVVAFVAMLLLGLHGYASDASHGILQRALTERGGRAEVIRAKLLLGLLSTVGLAAAVTVSTGLATLASGLPPGRVVPAYWPLAWVGLTLAFALYFLLGLVLATVMRSKAAAVVVGIGSIWVLVPALRAGASTHHGASQLFGQLVPTELAAAVLSWVPMESTLMDVPDGIALRVVVLVAWVTLLGLAWAATLRRRDFYPSESL